MAFGRLFGELSGRSLAQHAVPREGDLVTPTHNRWEAHTNDRTIIAATAADPAEYLGFGMAGASS